MLLEYDFLATLIWVRCYKKMHPPLTQRFHSHQRSQYSTLVQGFNIWSDYTYNFKQTSFRDFSAVYNTILWIYTIVFTKTYCILCGE